VGSRTPDVVPGEGVEPSRAEAHERREEPFREKRAVAPHWLLNLALFVVALAAYCVIASVIPIGRDSGFRELNVADRLDAGFGWFILAFPLMFPMAAIYLRVLQRAMDDPPLRPRVYAIVMSPMIGAVALGALLFDWEGSTLRAAALIDTLGPGVVFGLVVRLPARTERRTSGTSEPRAYGFEEAS
jgi:hypothetical protein